MRCSCGSAPAGHHLAQHATASATPAPNPQRHPRTHTHVHTVRPRCPTEEALDEFLSEEACLLDKRQLEAFWGLDSVAAAGLCRRVYAALRIPRKAYGALLRSPDVPGRPGSEEGVQAFVQLVKR